VAKYNTFVVINCKNRSVALVTSSARKALASLYKGRRVEVWCENEKTRTIYAKEAVEDMERYVEAEREYIRMKQLSAEVRNAKRGILRA